MSTSESEFRTAGGADVRNQRLSTLATALRKAASVSFVEPEILGLGQLVRPGDVCFDIGAAYGMYSFPLADLVGPHGAVHSFEPQPKPHRVLDTGRRLTGAAQIRLERAAVGRERGTSEITLPVRFGLPIHGHAHVREGLREQSRDTRLSTTRSLRTALRSVDEVCAERSVERVHFMKVDVEGFEPTVLEGARHLVERHRPALLMEVEDRHLTRYGTTADRFTGSLRELGYGLYTWRGKQWVRAERVTPEVRNYLFATDETWGR